MAAAVSQLFVWQGSTLSSGFISTKAVKVEQISPLFHLYLYLFFKSEEHPFFANLACQVNCTDIYGSRRMAKEKSTFQISSLLLSSIISNIYTPEKGYYWQNQPNGLKGKGVSRSQLQCQATTALRKNSVHLNRARGRVIEINVCER